MEGAVYMAAPTLMSCYAVLMGGVVIDVSRADFGTTRLAEPVLNV